MASRIRDSCANQVRLFAGYQIYHLSWGKDGSVFFFLLSFLRSAFIFGRDGRVRATSLDMDEWVDLSKNGDHLRVDKISRPKFGIGMSVAVVERTDGDE